MLKRVLEIAEENRYISLDRGFIVIESKGEELGRIPLDDVAVLLLSAQSIMLTKKIHPMQLISLHHKKLHWMYYN